MQKLIFCFAFIVICLKATAQSGSPQLTQAENLLKEKEIEGTYQIQVINSRANPFIPGNLKEIIQKNRSQSETIYVSLGTMVRLKILSENEIKRTDFVPLQKIKHISLEETQNNK